MTTGTIAGSCHNGPILGGVLRCIPAQVDQRYEYHWLEFDGRVKDVWRWRKDGWHSTLNGARFSPEQMHDHGWRYVAAIPPPLAAAA